MIKISYKQLFLLIFTVFLFFSAVSGIPSSGIQYTSRTTSVFNIKKINLNSNSTPIPSSTDLNLANSYFGYNYTMENYYAYDISHQSNLAVVEKINGTSIQLYNLDTRTFSPILVDNSSPFGRMGTSIFSPDGKEVAALDNNSRIHVWNVSDRSIISTVTLHGNLANIGSFYFIPNRPDLVAITSYNYLYIWNTSQSNPSVFTGKIHDYFVDSAASPNGIFLLSVDVGKNIILWNISDLGSVTNRTIRQTLDYYPSGCVLSNDGHYAIVADYNHMYVFDMYANASLVKTFSSPYSGYNTIDHIKIIPDSNSSIVAISNFEGAISFFNLNNLSGEYYYDDYSGVLPTSLISLPSFDHWTISNDYVLLGYVAFGVHDKRGTIVLEKYPLSKPLAPNGLTATYQNQSLPASIVLTWNRPARDGGFTIDFYRIYKSNGTNTNYFNLTDSSYKTNLEDHSIEPDTTYYYKVTAFNKLGEGLVSTEINVTTPPPPPTSSSLVVQSRRPTSSPLGLEGFLLGVFSLIFVKRKK